MLQLICLLFCLPFYILYWSIIIIYYAFILIISLIKTICEIFVSKKSNEKENISIANYNTDYDISNIKDYYNKLHYDQVKNNKEKIKNAKKYAVVQLTDTELRLTTEKIQELYKELGFNVKVIDIEKKKYTTEYEIIFPKEITQFDILSASSKITNKFQVDGVKIIENTKKDNGIYIQIPLKYEETLT